MVSFQCVESDRTVESTYPSPDAMVSAGCFLASILQTFFFLGCGDVVKKPKLDQHSGRCHGGFDCIDCSKTFGTPTEWKGHTSCISEAEKYQKSLYKGPTVRPLPSSFSRYIPTFRRKTAEGTILATLIEEARIMAAILEMARRSVVVEEEAGMLLNPGMQVQVQTPSL